MRVALVWLLAALPVLAGCANFRAGAAESASASPAPAPVDVQTAIATEGWLRPALTIPGAIAPDQTVALSNAINEPAQAVYVEEGDRVERGQRLAQLDTDDLQASLTAAEQTAQADQSRVSEAAFNAQLTVAGTPAQVRTAQASVNQAKATLAEAILNLQRDAKLVAQGYLPQQNYDEQAVVVQNDQQAVAAAESTLAESAVSQRVNGSTSSGLQAATVAAAQRDEAAQRATAEQLRREISRATITSPVDGVVVNRNLNPGEYPAGRQIFTVEAKARVFAILTASAVQAYQLRVGDAVSVVRAGIPNGRFSGRIVAVLDAATPGSTNFTVKVALPNPDDALRAGTPVQAAVSLTPLRGVIVPASAFVDDSHTQLVLVAGGKARTRHVVEESTDGANSIVAGLAAGARVLRNGATSIEPNAPVHVVR